MGVAKCPATLCQQISGLAQGGAVTANDFAVVYDPSLGCDGGLKIKKLPNENEVLKGAGAPSAPPADPTENKTWLDTTTSQITHYWDSTAAAWVPVVGTFPVIKKCDNTNAAPADRFITVDKLVAATAGVADATNHLMVFPDAGGCPKKLVTPATCTDVLPSPFGGAVLGPIDATGNIGLTRPTAMRERVVSGGAAAVDLLTTDVYVYNAAANGTVTVPTPAAGNLCQSNKITIKRTSNDPIIAVRVTAPAGIDGAPGNTIQLGTSTAFGIVSGESVTLVYDGGTWRVI